MITFAFSWVALLILVVSVLLPVITGFVTTRVTSSSRKAVVLAVLSAVTGFSTELLNALQSNVTYDAFTGLLTAITVFIVAVAMYFGFWKPTGIAVKAQNVGGIVK